MKKLISVLISVCILAGCFGITACADETNVYTANSVGAKNLYTMSVSTSLSKTNSKISYYCMVATKSNATEVNIYLYLQEYRDGKWVDVSAVSKTASTRTVYATNTYDKHVKGRKYRTDAHVYVYSGNKCEYIHSNSSVVTNT